MMNAGIATNWGIGKIAVLSTERNLQGRKYLTVGGGDTTQALHRALPQGKGIEGKCILI